MRRGPGNGGYSGGLDRRDFLKAGALGVAAGAISGCGEPGSGQASLSGAASVPGGLGAAPAQPFAAPPIDQVRIGFVGVGGMGTAHVRNLARIDGCAVSAVCDIREAHAERAADIIEEAGHPRPALYTNGETDFERLCAEADVDLVYTATPWRWHVPVCVAAMENGKHSATEVPAAYTLEDCWRLVETAERTNRHCLMMENVNYGRAELLCLNLVRQGLLGEILHSECGYLHDLRGIKLRTMVRGCGGATTHGPGTATCTPRTAWGRSPTAWTSTGATSSTTSSR